MSDSRSRSGRPGELVLTAAALNSTYFSEALKSGVFSIDKEGNLKTLPVIILDPTTNPVLALGKYNPLPVLQNFFNETTGAAEFARTPTVYRNVTALNAGTTAIWTSAAGRRWRLQGICITLMKGTTAAAASKLTILDVAADTGVGVDICAAAMTAVPGGLILLQGDFKNGILAAANNTALNANLSTALAAGGVSIQVWGCEE